MVTQTTYLERMAPLPPGSKAGTDHDIETGICETVSPGIPFGRAVSRGTLSDQGTIIGGAAATFKGISLRDATLDPRNNDAYLPPNNMGIVRRGFVWCEPTEAVADGDPVFFNATTGTLNKSTGVRIIGAEWADTAGIGGRSRVKLAGGRNVNA